jgi:predicted negative regulator of RcsB-dependent stress response
VDEFLSEKEQIAEIKQWFRENGPWLFGGVAIVLAGYFGYNQYGAWQDRTGEAAAAIYLEIRELVADDDRAGVDSKLAELAAEYPGSPYLDQARLLIAEDNLIRDPERSITELRAVVDRDGDPGLVDIARLRLARVLAWQERYDDALATLNVPEPGAFAARYSEVRGDIHAAMGNREAAASAYTDALLGGANGSVNTDFIQLKLSDVYQLSEPVTASPDAADESASAPTVEDTAAPAAATVETAGEASAEAGEPDSGSAE